MKWRRTTAPCTGTGLSPAQGGKRPAWEGPLQWGCFCQHSRQGEVLASRKDFRMNTCTPNSRGAFMLEPMGMCPVEPLGVCPMPRNQKGEGLDGGRELVGGKE
jgi:hypothetical protein